MAADTGDSGDAEGDTPPAAEDVIPDERTSLRTSVAENARQITGVALATATIVSAIPVATAVFDVFALTTLEQLLASLALVLLVAGSFAGKTAWDLWSNLRTVERRVAAWKQAGLTGARDPSRNTFFGLAFSIFLTEPPACYDSEHYLTNVEAEVDLTGDRLRFTETFSGYNASEKPTEYVSVLMTSDSTLSVEDTNFRMFHKSDGEFVESDDWTAQKLGAYEIVFRMWFEEPLEPGDHFEIRYTSLTSDWPMEGEQYIFLPYHRFTRGVEQLFATFEVDGLSDVEARKVSTDTSSYFRSASRIDFEMSEFETVTVHERSGSVEVTSTDEHASSLYLFRFDFE